MYKIFLIIFSYLCFLIVPVLAADKIVYIDLKILLNESIVGKNSIIELEKTQKLKNDEIKKIQESFKNEEIKLINKKNVISEKEFKDQVNLLRSKVKKHNESKKIMINDLTQKRIDITSKLLAALNPILTEYSSKNSIAIILQKKDIIIGSNDLDITPIILKIFNQRVKKITLN